MVWFDVREPSPPHPPAGQRRPQARHSRPVIAGWGCRFDPETGDGPGQSAVSSVNRAGPTFGGQPVPWTAGIRRFAIDGVSITGYRDRGRR